MHHENNGDPDSNKLSCYGDKLKPKPDLTDIGLINDTPCVIKRDQSFPRFYAGLFKHTVHAYMPSYYVYRKNEPAHK
jgi:hypothetical protein